jgi:RND family efflux transporter MFP subunit
VNRKWIIAGGFIAVVGLLVWANLRQTSTTSATAKEGPKTGPLVKVVSMKFQDLTQAVTAPGTLEASDVKEIRAPFTSTHVKLLVGTGDQVVAGQVLAELDSQDFALQVASQEAGVARAQASIAQLNQQRALAPLQLSQRLESAKAQLAQTQQSLDAATRQSSGSQQRLDQAKANLAATQSRAARSGENANAARLKLETAENAYRANPLDLVAHKAYDDARTAYQLSLNRASEETKQIAADLAQANQTLDLAEQELTAKGGGDSFAVQQAQGQVASARMALDAAQKEAEAGGTLIEQIRAADADRTVAQLSLEAARQRLAQAQLKAPANGTVLTLGLKDGQPVQQNQLLLEVGGLNTLKLTARIDEVDVVKVKPGQALTIKTNAFLGDSFTGLVTRVAAQVTSDPRSTQPYYEVQVEVQNPEGKLRAGMTGQGRIVTDMHTHVLVVGLEAVREDGNIASVLIVKDFKITIRPVKLGLRTQTRVEIIDGLKEGEQVMVGPFTLIRSLKDGDGVRVEVTDLPDPGVEE